MLWVRKIHAEHFTSSGEDGEGEGAIFAVRYLSGVGGGALAVAGDGGAAVRVTAAACGARGLRRRSLAFASDRLQRLPLRHAVDDCENPACALFLRFRLARSNIIP